MHMGKYRISGIWKDNDVIIAYAVHEIFENCTGRAEKKTKEQTIAILETYGNSASTWVWNYTTGRWIIGEPVSVLEDNNGKYLCSNRRNKLTFDLGHLLNLGWVNYK